MKVDLDLRLIMMTDIGFLVTLCNLTALCNIFNGGTGIIRAEVLVVYVK